MAKAEVAAIEKRCEQIAADMGYELVDVAIEKEPTGKYLRFYIDRPLKKDRDFERALGTEVEIKLFKAIDGVKVITGTLAGLEDGDIVLDTPEGEKRVARKAAALVKPIVDMSGVEDVDLGEDQTS